MVDITKLISGQIINRVAQPVEETRRVQPTDNNEQRRQASPPAPAAKVAAAAAPDEDVRTTAKQEVEKWASSINDFLKSNNMSLRFQVVDETDQIVVKIVNNDTGETIRQIPSEELVELAERMRDAAGLLVDKKL